jgi:hypothetical protein
MRSVSVRQVSKFDPSFIGSLLVAMVAANVLVACGGGSNAVPSVVGQNVPITGSESAKTLLSAPSSSECDSDDVQNERKWHHRKNDHRRDCASPSPVPSSVPSPVPSVGQTGKIYITGGNTVTTYNLDGTQTTPTITSGLNRAEGIAVDAAGKIHVTNTDALSRFRFVTTYNPVGSLTVPSIQLPFVPYGIAVH